MDPIVASLAVGFFLIAIFRLFSSGSRSNPKTTRVDYDYDVVVVGNSITGPVIAKALSDQGRKVLIVERALWEKPDRIIGELLQPGGIMALKKVGMDGCALSIGMEAVGYYTVDSGQWVQLPFKKGFKGCSFHFGDFVNNLRGFVWKNCRGNVDIIEGTVNEVLLSKEGRAYGIKYTKDEDYKVPTSPFDGKPVPAKEGDVKKTTCTATAPLVVMCDGGSSRFKSQHQHYTPAKDASAHFVGIIMKGIQLPHEKHGHVFLGTRGPILAYRLDPNEVRFLIDYPEPALPGLEGQQQWLRNEIKPQLPESMQEEFERVLSDKKNLRSMPLAQYCQTYPAYTGYVGLGDHNNQRHPLTGGGMTCCFRDALSLAEKLAPIRQLRVKDAVGQAAVEDQIQDAILSYSRQRYAHSSCINILSWALYAVFGGPVSMRRACFDYFLLGGDAVEGPMALLSGLDPSAWSLMYHYVRVMIFGAMNLITGRMGGKTLTTAQLIFNTVTFFVNPMRIGSAIFLLCYATYVFTPLLMMEWFSVWRYVDPTSPIARAGRAVQRSILRLTRGPKVGKPVGL